MLASDSRVPTGLSRSAPIRSLLLRAKGQKTWVRLDVRRWSCATWRRNPLSSMAVLDLLGAGAWTWAWVASAERIPGVAGNEPLVLLHPLGMSPRVWDGVRRLVLRDVAVHGDRLTVAQAIEATRDMLACTVADDTLFTNEEIAPLDPAPCPITLAWASDAPCCRSRSRRRRAYALAARPLRRACRRRARPHDRRPGERGPNDSADHGQRQAEVLTGHRQTLAPGDATIGSKAARYPSKSPRCGNGASYASRPAPGSHRGSAPRLAARARMNSRSESRLR